MKDRLNSIPLQDYYVLTCDRLKLSFKRIFDAHVKWGEIPDTLKDQKKLSVSLWPTTSPEFKTAVALKELYQRLIDPQNQTDPEILKAQRNFLEDTEERQRAIKFMRPYFLFAYMTERQLSCSRVYFPQDQQEAAEVGNHYSEMGDMFRACLCYEDSIKKNKLLLEPQTDFNLWYIYLTFAFSRARIAHDIVGLDFTNEPSQERVKETLTSSVQKFIESWHQILPRIPSRSYVRVPFKHISERANIWLADIIENKPYALFSDDEKKKLKDDVKSKINTYLYGLLLARASQRNPQLPPISYFQFRAFYALEAVDLAENSDQKADTYSMAAKAKGEEAGLLNKDTEHQKKAEAWAKSAHYFAQAAELFTEPAKRGLAYNQAGEAKWEEADLLEFTEPLKEAEAWAKAAHYYAQAAELFTNPARRASAYNQAGSAKWNEAYLIEPQKRAETLSKSAHYYFQAAEVSTDATIRAAAYYNAGEAKRKEAEELAITEHQKKAEAWATSAHYCLSSDRCETEEG